MKVRPYTHTMVQPLTLDTELKILSQVAPCLRAGAPYTMYKLWVLVCMQSSSSAAGVQVGSVN